MANEEATPNRKVCIDNPGGGGYSMASEKKRRVALYNMRPTGG